MSLTLPTLTFAECPHVEKTEDGCECKVVHRTSAKEVCDSESVVRWCLSPRHTECLFFRGHIADKKKRFL